MSALGHINMLVKCSGSSLPSARSGAVARTSKAPSKPGSDLARPDGRGRGPRRLTADEVYGIASKGAIPGAGSVFKKDKDGNAWITPEQGRISAYRHVLRKHLGNLYERSKADRLALEDFRNAQKARFDKLVSEGFLPATERFDEKKNYAVVPHRTDVFGGGNRQAALSYGNIDSLVPIYDVDSSVPNRWLGYVTQNAHRAAGNRLLDGRIGSIHLNTGNPRLGSGTFIHESLHTGSLPVYFSEDTGSTLVGGDDLPRLVNGKSRDVYAMKPSEGLVGTVAEKAMMRAKGYSGSKGLGRAWAREVLGNWDALGKGDEDDVRLNAHSLRIILKKLHDAATSETATEDDRKRYVDFLDKMDWNFEQARNSPGRQAAGSSWSDFSTSARA